MNDQTLNRDQYNLFEWFEINKTHHVYENMKGVVIALPRNKNAQDYLDEDFMI